MAFSPLTLFPIKCERFTISKNVTVQKRFSFILFSFIHIAQVFPLFVCFFLNFILCKNGVTLENKAERDKWAHFEYRHTYSKCVRTRARLFACVKRQRAPRIYWFFIWKTTIHAPLKRKRKSLMMMMLSNDLLIYMKTLYIQCIWGDLYRILNICTQKSL